MQISYASVRSYILTFITGRYFAYYDVLDVVPPIPFPRDIGYENMRIDEVLFVVPNRLVVSQLIVPLCKIIEPGILLDYQVGCSHLGCIIVQPLDLQTVHPKL